MNAKMAGRQAGSGRLTASTVLHNLPLPPGQVAGILLSVILHGLRPVRLPDNRVGRRTVGAVLLFTGVAINYWAIVERRRREPADFDLAQPATLVTTGPYSFTRHPMYVGWWLIHLGAGILGGSAWTPVTLIAAAVAEHPVVLAEERKLAEEFGTQYHAYSRRVRRYLPVADQFDCYSSLVVPQVYDSLSGY